MELNVEPLEGCKVLHKLPEYLSKVPFNGETKVIEMGTLGNYKRFMATHKDFTNTSHTSSMRADDDDFSGSRDYDHFQDIITNGDAEVMNAIKVDTKKQIAELGKKYEEQFTRYKFDVTGEFFDVGLVLTGVPEAWLEPEITEIEKVRVELVINGTFSAGVDKKTIIKSTSRILAMAKILEDHDVQVKIKIVSLISGFSSTVNDLAVATDVKDYDEPINYKKCSALLSPTYLRRGMFKVMELVGGLGLYGSYGSPKYNVEGFIDLDDNAKINKLEKTLFANGGK